jgi:hypothetical protein
MQSLRGGEVCFALVATVLGRDTIAVGAGLLAFLKCYV